MAEPDPDLTAELDRAEDVVMDREPLLTDLAAYLDWPVGFADDAVWCAAQGCPSCPSSFAPAWICGLDGLTPRELLKAIKAHAEGRPRP